jgi:hypothetical protein
MTKKKEKKEKKDNYGMDSLGKEKLYLVGFENEEIKPVPIIAESIEGARKEIEKNKKYKDEKIKEIKFKESYYPWNHKLTGVYGAASDESWLD